MLERLELTKNAQFYTLKEIGGSIGEHFILDILNASDDNIEPDKPFLGSASMNQAQ